MDVAIAMMIMGLLAGIAAPKFAATLGRNRAEAAARRVRADLALARQAAIARSDEVRVEFFPGTGDYTLDDLPDLDRPLQNYAVDLSRYPYHATVPSAALGGNAEVRFDHFGHPDSGGIITVQVGSFSRTVTVDPDTGKATIP